MGGGQSILTPLPPGYFTMTFRPANELWLCQPPWHLVLFIRSILLDLWPRDTHAERHCKGKRRSVKNDGHEAISNSIFRIPSNPFATTPTHQARDATEAAYKFITYLLSYIYESGYEQVASGHFVRGTEASTCIFRRKRDTGLSEDVNTNEIFNNDESTVNCFSMKKSEDRKNRLSFDSQLTAVGIEGWNKLIFVNIQKSTLMKIEEKFKKMWPEGLESTFEASKGNTHPDEHISFMLKLAGHPWDSFKEYSDFSPCLLMTLFNTLREDGYEFVTRLSFRGCLDTLFFREVAKTSTDESSLEVKSANVYFTLCHQNCVRVYGGSLDFATWITSLMQRIWAPGVVYERRITLSPLTEHDALNDTYIETMDLFDYTEIKLAGTPWFVPEWNKDIVLASQYMITRFVSVLSFIGWQLTASINMYCSPYDKGFLLFEKLLIDGDNQTTIDLEMVEFLSNNDYFSSDDDSGKFPKRFDFLMPLCLTPYDVDRICVFGGSKNFLLQFNHLFSSLFTTSCIACDEKQDMLPIKPTSPVADNRAFPYANWISSRPRFLLELIQKMYVENPLVSCIIKPQETNPQSNIQMALTSIDENDPENYLEYAAHYRMYSNISNWPPKMFRKIRHGGKEFFYRSQLPLSLFCWAHEILMIMGSNTEDNINNVETDKDRIIKIGSGWKTNCTSEHQMLMCLDSASTSKDGPPSWIYLVREKKKDVIPQTREIKNLVIVEEDDIL